MINFIEAQDEAKQLTKNLRRDVEVKPVNCDCEYSRDCYQCGGAGLFYQCVYASCNHVVREDGQECVENFCAEREVAATTFALEHEPICSLIEATIDREEAA